ncbi:hypothetical protein D0T08_26715 [Emticicia sp. C21]|nr:hypothetical protein D0T08_26715 [Emticicia sp. C21]
MYAKKLSAEGKETFLTNKHLNACCPHLFTTVVFRLGWVSANGNFLILLQSKTFRKTKAKFRMKIYLQYIECHSKLSLNKFQIGQFIYQTTIISEFLPF